MSNKVPTEDPTNFKEAKEWDKMSLGEWIDRNSFTNEAKQIYKTSVNTILGDPSKISLLFWLSYCSRAGGFLRLSSVESGAQERFFSTGAQSIFILFYSFFIFIIFYYFLFFIFLFLFFISYFLFLFYFLFIFIFYFNFLFLFFIFILLFT